MNSTLACFALKVLCGKISVTCWSHMWTRRMFLESHGFNRNISRSRTSLINLANNSLWNTGRIPGIAECGNMGICHKEPRPQSTALWAPTYQSDHNLTGQSDLSLKHVNQIDKKWIQSEGTYYDLLCWSAVTFRKKFFQAKINSFKQIYNRYITFPHKRGPRLTQKLQDSFVLGVK